jgi:hypothetical protein
VSKLRGKRILVMTGTDDVDHPQKLDGSIVEWLNQNGAKAEFIYLGDRDIIGLLALDRGCCASKPPLPTN